MCQHDSWRAEHLSATQPQTPGAQVLHHACSGGFLKRDARQRDNEVLVARLVDRPLRPMFPQGWANDTQVLTWVMSYDGVHSPEPLAITAASAALVISGWPNDAASPKHDVSEVRSPWLMPSTFLNELRVKQIEHGPGQTINKPKRGKGREEG